MKLHALCNPPQEQLSVALAAFEGRFTYPLGPSTTFSISHGGDYSRFFRAMGPCRVVVAERNNEVLGTMAGAVRSLQFLGETNPPALYIGDLKVLPGNGAGRTLLRLATNLRAWSQPQVNAAYCVVMDGTSRTPLKYTGRCDIPAFEEIGKIAVLRLACKEAALSDTRLTCGLEEGMEIVRRLTYDGYAAFGGDSAARSIMKPHWLRVETGTACGMLEDTRHAKRLFELGGQEICSAHLSNFAFADIQSAVQLLNHATDLAATLGFPDLFCAVPAAIATELVSALGEPAPIVAPATVYGTGLANDAAWYVNTSEI